MHRVGPPDHSVEVEIVDVRDAADARRDGDVGPRRARRHVGWLGATVLAVLGMLVMVTNVVEARRESSRLADLAVAGVLQPIDGPVQEVWRAPGGRLLANSPEAIVLVDLPGDAGLRGLDPATGALLWHREIASDETCLAVGGHGYGGSPEAPVLVVCGPLVDGDDPSATPARLVALDVRTGSEAAALDLVTPPMTLDVVDDDIVISRIGDRAAVQVLRWDPGADRVVWSYRSEPGMAAALLRGGWWNSVVDRGVLWLGQDRVIALAAASGQEVPADDPPAFWSVGGMETLADGGSVEWAHDRSGDSTGSRVLDEDGHLRFTFGGEPWLAQISDGSEPDVLPMRRLGTLDVVGLDARTGEQQWAARTLQGMYPYVQIDGVVVATGSLRAIGLDLATGTRLWEEPIARPRTWPVTDGRVVLLLTREGGLLGMSAIDLRTGAERWWAEMPATATYLDVGGDSTVLVHTAREVVGYR